jgi:hypothetical protein
VQQSSRQSRERQQVAPVVLEDCGQRPRIAGAHELEIPAGNLKPGHVANAGGAEHVPLERHQRATRLLRCEPVNVAAAHASPESPCRVEHIDVGQRPARRCHAVEQVPCFEYRCVEGFSVEAHNCASALDLRGDRAQHGSLGGKIHQQVLLGDEPIVGIEPRGANHEDVRAGAAAQTCRFQIEEHERRARSRHRHQGRRRRPLTQLTGQVSDP